MRNAENMLTTNKEISKLDLSLKIWNFKYILKSNFDKTLLSMKVLKNIPSEDYMFLQHKGVTNIRPKC